MKTEQSARERELARTAKSMSGWFRAQHERKRKGKAALAIQTGLMALHRRP